MGANDVLKNKRGDIRRVAAPWLELQELLGCEVDVVSEKGLRPRMRDRVLKEAVPL